MPTVVVAVPLEVAPQVFVQTRLARPAAQISAGKSFLPAVLQVGPTRQRGPERWG